MIGKSGAAYRFACQVCDGAGTETVVECEDEPAGAAGTGSADPVCIRCRGAAASCPLCCGAGVATLPEQAAALRAA